jgi:hypothetical protein
MGAHAKATLICCGRRYAVEIGLVELPGSARDRAACPVCKRPPSPELVTFLRQMIRAAINGRRSFGGMKGRPSAN